MEYYKVKSNKDVLCIKFGNRNSNCYFLANELLTKRELEEKLKRFKFFRFETKDYKIKNDKTYYTKDEFIKKIFEVVKVENRKKRT